MVLEGCWIYSQESDFTSRHCSLQFGWLSVKHQLTSLQFSLFVKLPFSDKLSCHKKYQHANVVYIYECVNFYSSMYTYYVFFNFYSPICQVDCLHFCHHKFIFPHYVNCVSSKNKNKQKSSPRNLLYLPLTTTATSNTKTSTTLSMPVLQQTATNAMVHKSGSTFGCAVRMLVIFAMQLLLPFTLQLWEFVMLPFSLHTFVLLWNIHTQTHTHTHAPQTHTTHTHKHTPHIHTRNDYNRLFIVPIF